MPTSADDVDRAPPLLKYLSQVATAAVGGNVKDPLDEKGWARPRRVLPMRDADQTYYDSTLPPISTIITMLLVMVWSLRYLLVPTTLVCDVDMCLPSL